MSRHARSVTVAVPATTANLGPGYDCLGLALGLHNEVTLTAADTLSVHIEGEGAGSLARDASHLVLVAAAAACAAAQREMPPLALHQVNRIPLARGLGSSSAAIVGGIVGANELLGLGLTPARMLDIATAVEGHPDNVAPALLGGLTVCCTAPGEVLVERLEVAPGLACVVAIPDFEVATHEARRVLPDLVPHADAVFNLCRTGLLVAALVCGDFARLGEVMRDRLHQPYRAPLVPGMDEAIAAALDAGAHGAALSGSGPTVAAFVTDGGEEVGAAMVNAFARVGTTAVARVLPLCAEGARIVR
ncbi:MAG: homoserine kinase [Armatimonadota bacterium]